MRRLRFYLDSSFWIQLSDLDDSEYERRQASHGFLKRSSRRHDLLISRSVVEEIAKHWNKLATLKRLAYYRPLRRPEQIPPRRRAKELAKTLQVQGGFGDRMLADLTHVSYAILSKADALVTWDVRTLAREKVRRVVRHVCRREGLRPPLIGTPEEVIRWRSLRE